MVSVTAHGARVLRVKGRARERGKKKKKKKRDERFADATGEGCNRNLARFALAFVRLRVDSLR